LTGDEHREEPRPPEFGDGIDHQAEEKRFRAAYESLVDQPVFGMAIYEGDRLVYANKALARTLGYGAEELLGMSRQGLMRLVHPDDRPWLAQYRSPLLKGELADASLECRVLRKDGGVRWVRVTAATGDHDGRPALHLYILDITEKKQTERALEASELRVRALLEGAGDAIFLHDVDGDILDFNQAACDALGYTRDELIGMTVAELDADHDAPDVRRLGERVCSGEHFTFETRHIRKDGHVVPVELRLSSVVWRDQQIVLAVARDIAERKEAEATVRRQRDFARELLDTAHAIVLVLDTDGNVTLFNRFAQELTGYSAEEAMGLNWFETFLPPADRDRIRSAFRRVLKGGQYRGVENRILTKSGRHVLIRWDNSILTDEEDRVAGVLAIGNDVTEARATEEQLRQAVKMEAIGRLAGGVAHDFNNMLAIIQGYADLVIQALGEEHPQVEDVVRIRSAAARASNLTRQLLILGRRQIDRPRVIRINDIVRPMETMLRRTIGEDIDFDVTLAVNVPPVYADPTQIEEVVLNLVVNAREAMPEGGRLTIETTRAEVPPPKSAAKPRLNPGSYALLTVSDTGSGMSEEVRGRVFEPFFTTKQIGEGTGLGLATCYGIVTHAGGHIEVDSAPDRGSTFRVFLPRTEREPPSAPQGEPEEAQLRAGTETVLVVEDEAPVRRIIVRVLRGAGYEVLAASGPPEAVPLGLHHDGPIHLLVTDVVMPGGDGTDLARRLLEARPEMGVLYISGYAGSAALVQQELPSGPGPHPPGRAAAEMLPKPFTATELAEAVRRVLDRAARKGGTRKGGS
jgi:PAS domain S-box-containing protein